VQDQMAKEKEPKKILKNASAKKTAKKGINNG